jgi:hypothetical protein
MEISVTDEQEFDYAAAIINTTPEEVYRVLRGYDRSLFVDTGSPYNCPLHHYFCDSLLLEPDDVHVDMESVTLVFRGEGEFVYPLPQWMNDYQEMLSSPPFPMTIGECLDVLAKMYPEVLDEEEEDDEEYTVEACIAALEDQYGADRDPISSTIYYLKQYAASLAYEEERN